MASKHRRPKKLQPKTIVPSAPDDQDAVAANISSLAAAAAEFLNDTPVEAPEVLHLVEDSEAMDISQVVGATEGLQDLKVLEDSETAGFLEASNVENSDAAENSEEAKDSDAAEYLLAVEESEVLEDSEAVEGSERIELSQLEDDQAESEAVDEGAESATLESFAASSSGEPSEEFGADPTEDNELAAYAAAEDEIRLEDHQVASILESLLFASDKPISFDLIRQAFKGTNVKTQQIKSALEQYRLELAHGQRGVVLEDVAGGYQIRTKPENADFLRRSVKNRVFRLSGPALEVMAIVAYQQPIIKAQIDEIRGVDSGHLLRALMDRGLVKFAGKSEFPGRPMLYETSRKFLEIFGLRNLRELPSPSEIDDLIPEGIGEPETPERNLGALTSELSVDAGLNYSQGEDELLKITGELSAIETTTEFFEKEKLRQKQERERQRAEDIRENIVLGQPVETKDLRWLERYEKDRLAEQVASRLEPAVEASGITNSESSKATKTDRSARLEDQTTPGLSSVARVENGSADQVAAVADDVGFDVEAASADQVAAVADDLSFDVEAASADHVAAVADDVNFDVEAASDELRFETELELADFSSETDESPDRELDVASPEHQPEPDLNSAQPDRDFEL